MDEWHTIVLAFQRDMYKEEEGHEALLSLRKLIVDFIEPLKTIQRKKSNPISDVGKVCWK